MIEQGLGEEDEKTRGVVDWFDEAREGGGGWIVGVGESVVRFRLWRKMVFSTSNIELRYSSERR